MRDDWQNLALFYWMLGVSVAHGLRFVLFHDPINRQIVAAGGVLIYGIAALLAAVEKKGTALAAYSITIGFPLVGLLLVLVTGSNIDNWQLAVGVTQFAAALYSAHQLCCRLGVDR